MGCGGSRTDALEPRSYLESWTKETESTWLNTDTDIPLSSIQSIPSENSSETGFPSEKTLSHVPDLFEDGLPPPAQAYFKVCSSLSEASLTEAKASGLFKVCSSLSEASLTEAKASGLFKVCSSLSEASLTEAKAPTLLPPLTVQRRSVLRTEEITKWQDNRMSTKQVTITVTQSIRQVDKNGKIKEKSLTTYEVMKPLDTQTPLS